MFRMFGMHTVPWSVAVPVFLVFRYIYWRNCSL